MYSSESMAAPGSGEPSCLASVNAREGQQAGAEIRATASPKGAAARISARGTELKPLG
jgi:hypothetical protein